MLLNPLILPFPVSRPLLFFLPGPLSLLFPWLSPSLLWSLSPTTLGYLNPMVYFLQSSKQDLQLSCLSGCRSNAFLPSWFANPIREGQCHPCWLHYLWSFSLCRPVPSQKTMTHAGLNVEHGKELMVGLRRPELLEEIQQAKLFYRKGFPKCSHVSSVVCKRFMDELTCVYFNVF